MTPLPKRRHSTRRGGKREKTNLTVTLPIPGTCPKCHSPKLQHRTCPNCGYYKEK